MTLVKNDLLHDEVPHHLYVDVCDDDFTVINWVLFRTHLKFKFWTK